MRSSLLLVLAFSCAVFASYSGIWPQQLAFSPGKSTGWSELQNSVTAPFATVVFYTNPIIIPPLNVSLSFNQVGSWGFSLSSDGYIPSIDITGENVTVYVNTGNSWSYSDSGVTNVNGDLDLTIGFVPGLGTVYPILHLLTPDNHFGRSAIWRLNVDTPTIVFTIDGTLTTGTFSSICGSISSCNPTLRNDAANIAIYWYNLNYQLVYVGVRPPSLYESTLNFLVNNGFPPGILRLADSADLAFNDQETVVYDAVVEVQNGGASVSFAYGNSDNDINAFERAGISGKNIYVVGGNSGDFGSVDIGNDFASQYNNFTSSIISNPIAVPGGVRIFGTTGTIENNTSSASSIVPFFAAIVLAFLFLL